MWDVGVDGVPVTCCRWGGIVGEWMEVDNGIPGDHVGELRCNVFRGSSLEVLGFLVELEVMRRVVGWLWLERGW